MDWQIWLSRAGSFPPPAPSICIVTGVAVRRFQTDEETGEVGRGAEDVEDDTAVLDEDGGELWGGVCEVCRDAE